MMIKLAAIATIWCLLGCVEEPAVEPGPDRSEHVYWIEFSDGHGTREESGAHGAWRRSLVANLGHTGDTHVFMLTDLRLKEAGEVSKGSVYQSARDSAQFLVVPASGEVRVIVDRNVREIGTMGVVGISLHPHPDGEMVVCLEPTPGTGILGVPLSDTEKTGAPSPPVFSDDSVAWTWGR